MRDERNYYYNIRSCRYDFCVLVFSFKERKIFSLIKFVFKNVSVIVFSTDWQKDIFLEPYDLNQDKNISGILIQLPLPKQINTQTIIEAIDPNKDIDGFHPINIGLLAQKHPRFRPCTPYGIMELLKHTGIHLAGKDVIVIGASLIVGLPMTLELLMKDCTVTTCHAETKNLSNKIKQADIVIAAIGQPNYIKGKWIKENAIVIDVGINRLPDGTLTGDVDFESAKEKASWITPVPGGVGPMTVAMLLQNALLAAALHLT